MARATNAVASRRRKKRLFKLAKGNFGGRKNLLRTAQETVMRGQAFAFRDRKRKKREFRQLWITRISGALNGMEISYSRFICGLKKAGIELNRLELSELAVNNPEAFRAIVEKARAAV